MKLYERPMSATWWMHQKHYLLFMLREVSSVFIAVYLVMFLVMIHRVIAQDQAGYETFLEGLQSPLAILFHLVALAFALLHTITWFQLTPKAVAIWQGEKRVPPALIIFPNYVAWAIVSVVIGWLVLGS